MKSLPSQRKSKAMVLFLHLEVCFCSKDVEPLAAKAS